jgi:dTDP-L-rhamnose 4-epimerase
MALDDDRMAYEVYNVGGGKPYTVFEFSEIVRKEIQNYHDTELDIAEIPGLYRYGDTRNACSNISEIQKLGWQPDFTPSDSVREYVEWLYAQDNVEDILEYADRTMQQLNVVRAIDNQKTA